jgi:ribosomal protein S18 acetylase RimI-like enzyme
LGSKRIGELERREEKFLIVMKREESFEEFKPEIGLAIESDLSDIAGLQQENLARNVSEEERQQQGFVSVETTPELLQEIAEQEGIIIARAGEKVVGYLMPMSVEHGKQIPLLDPFIGRFKHIQFEGKPLDEYRYCILGQACVAKNYRGRGILEKLYQELETRLADKYDLGVSEIGANNPRSLRAHLGKIGLKVAERYSAEGRDWFIVILDFRPFKKKFAAKEKL